MLPIGDDNSDIRIVPVVNYIFIIVNILVFILIQNFGTDDSITYAYATVPKEILTGRDVVTSARILTDPLTGEHFRIPGLLVTPIPVFLTLITSMFMHGGIAHIAGNMLYLWVFGDNIESRLGHARYFFFYLLCGVIASLSHVFGSAIFGSNLLVPSLGASGAISAVLGAYVLLFPTRRVKVWLFIFIINVPAFIVLGLWIAFQITSGLGMLGGNEDGVAYMAHIGGFFAGLILVKKFAPRLKQPVRNKYFQF